MIKNILLGVAAVAVVAVAGFSIYTTTTGDCPFGSCGTSDSVSAGCCSSKAAAVEACTECTDCCANCTDCYTGVICCDPPKACCGVKVSTKSDCCKLGEECCDTGEACCPTDKSKK